MPKKIILTKSEIEKFFLAVKGGQWEFTVHQCASILKVCKTTFNFYRAEFKIPERGKGNSKTGE